MKIFICNQCTREFQGVPSKHPKYCSKSCVHESQKVRINKNCQWCNKVYETVKSADKNRNRSKYCSVECRQEYLKRLLTRNKETKCADCGEIFTQKPSSIKKFCSRKCYYSSGGRQSTGKSFLYTCNGCGSNFRDSPSRHRQYCSKECFYETKTKHATNRYGKRFTPLYVSLKNKFKICERCGETSKIHVHHVDGDYSNDTKENLIGICSKCHRVLHALFEAAKCSLKDFTHSFMRNY